MIQIDHLHAFKGDKKLVIDDASDKKRKKLASHVLEIIKLGHAVFVEKDGKTYRVRGYDALDNTWIVGDSSQKAAPATTGAAPEKKRRGRPSKIPASDTKATTVPARAGG